MRHLAHQASAQAGIVECPSPVLEVPECENNMGLSYLPLPTGGGAKHSSMEMGRDEGRTLSSVVSWQATVPTQCARVKVVHKYPESLSVLPISWDIILSIYRELVRLINRLPFKKKLIVCIVYRGSKFRVDLGEGE